MTLNKEVEFNNIVSDILKNEDFINLKYERHHGSSRMQHSLNVSRLTFGMCKLFDIKKTKETTRAALLHDFYLNKDIKGIAMFTHPQIAAQKAKIIFNVDDFQYNIISSHMFPVSKVLPKSKEDLLVGLADKIIAVIEFTKYKIPATITTSFLFFLNIIYIQK